MSENAAVAVAEVAGGGNQLILRGVAAGEAVVVVTARDPFGAEASQPMTVTVRTNAAPEAAQPLPQQTLLAGTTSEPLDLTPYFHDPDGDPSPTRRCRTTPACSSPRWRRAAAN